MACDKPMLRIYYRDVRNPDTGKQKTYKILGCKQCLEDDAINSYYKQLIANYSDNKSLDLEFFDLTDKKWKGMQLIPCGQCIGCRLDYSRQWATRCVLEAKQYEFNYFVTLTYDEEHIVRLPHHVGADPDTGEVLFEGNPAPLIPGHLTTFMKDLREFYRKRLVVPEKFRCKFPGLNAEDGYKLNHDGIRFFASGEYGSQRLRPHFHIILFNCPILDLELYSHNFRGEPLYTSKSFRDIWKFGNIIIAECNFDTCAYVARYILKKQTGQNGIMYDIMGLTPEFSRMSRMPGIGKFYFDENSDYIYRYDQVTIAGGNGKVLQPRPPAYYDKLFAELHPDEFENVKENRKIKMIVSESSRLFQHGVPKATEIKVKANVRKRQVAKLARNI